MTLALPAVVLAVMLGLWWSRGRDPDPRPVDVRYDPPDGLTPAECGVLLEARTRLQHLSATLLDLLARGHLAVEEVEPPPGDELERDFRFRALTPPSEWDDLSRHEELLLHVLFSPSEDWPADLGPVERALRTHFAPPSPRDSVRMSDFGQPLRLVRGMGAFFEGLVERGYFPRRPGSTRVRYAGGAALLLFLGLNWATVPSVQVSIALSALIIGAVGWHMPARSPEGRRAAEHVMGFREYLERTAADQLERTGAVPENVDRRLAYGTALGLESVWAAAIDPLYGDRIETVEEGEADAYQRAALAIIEGLLRPGKSRREDR